MNLVFQFEMIGQFKISADKIDLFALFVVFCNFLLKIDIFCNLPKVDK